MVKGGNKKSLKQKQNCTICMVRKSNCQAVECSHQFCYRCLSKWTRRKGNCPNCRQDIRKIIYKNKVIQPQFLKLFDEEKLILSQQIEISPNRVSYMPYFLINHPTYAPFHLQQAQSLHFMQALNFFTFPYNPSS